jgi:hypothetical protein
MKLDIYEKIKDGLNMADNDRLSAYLEGKVAKMDRDYLELLFRMIFQQISNKDQVVQMIAQGQIQQQVHKKVYKTVIRPQFNVIPYNIKSIENILNRVYNFDKKTGRLLDKYVDASTQIGNDQGISKMTVSVMQNSSLDKIRQKSKYFCSKTGKNSKLMNIKKKFTRDEYNIMPDKLNNMMILNRSTNSFNPHTPDGFKNRTNPEMIHNVYSQSSLSKMLDSSYLMKTGDLTSQMFAQKEEFRNNPESKYFCKLIYNLLYQKIQNYRI